MPSGLVVTKAKSLSVPFREHIPQAIGEMYACAATLALVPFAYTHIHPQLTALLQEGCHSRGPDGRRQMDFPCPRYEPQG